jgi:DNA-binding beta-propeller fold protein YncE
MICSRFRRAIDASRFRARAVVVALVFALATFLYSTTPAPATINNGENAEDILGQFSTQTTDTTPSYTTNCLNNGASPIGFANDVGIVSNQSPFKVALDFTNHWLFATDSSNNRILVFPLNSSTNLVSSKTPSYYLNVSSSTSCIGLTGYFQPSGLAVDPVNHWLYVGASYDGAMYVFNTSSMSTGETPSYVIGGTTIGARSVGTTQSIMGAATGLALDVANQLLYVADNSNNRVMVFPAKGNASWGGNGENALYELGVPSGASEFTTAGSGTASQSTLNSPAGLAYDSTNELLYVADAYNNRVMIFPAYGNASWTGDGENALYVLGQSGFTTNGNGTSQSTLYTPSDVAVDPAHSLVYVADTINGRIMVFSTTSLSNGENAIAVLGATNFTTQWRNQGMGGNTSQMLMDGPDGLAIDPTNQLLYSSDQIDSRIMEFNVSSLAAAQFSTVTQSGNDGCGVSSNGALYCWGNGNDGEDGVGTGSTGNEFNNLASPQEVGTATNWTAISQGFGNTNIDDLAACGIAGGALYCWGDNAYGELGLGSGAVGNQYYTPQQVGSDTHWTVVSTSGSDTCGIDNGKLYCWGKNLYGEVGNGAPNYNTVFVASTSGSPTNGDIGGGSGGVTAANTICQNASTAGGSVAPAGTYLAWIASIKNGSTGANDPYTTFTHSTIPYKEVNGTMIAGNWTALLSGTLANGITLDQTGTPQSGDVWTNVSATTGQASTNGSSANRNCTAWTVGTTSGTTNEGRYGTLGSTSTAWSQASGEIVCGTSAYILCFEQSTGSNEVNSPVQIGTDTTWTAVSTGSFDTCGIDNGKLYCWGYNTGYEDGQGNTIEYVTPQQVGTATNWIAISQSGYDTCGIQGSGGQGALYCWGENFNGELGSSTSPITTPTQVGTATNWTAISVEAIGNGWNGDACGIAGGTLYCSGNNYAGQLGIGNTTNQTTFQTVGSLTNWTAVSQGYADTCGIAGGQLYCWGGGGAQMGLDSNTQYSTPQPVDAFDVNLENATDEIGQYASQTSTATVSWTQNSPENGANALSMWTPDGVTMDPVNHYLYVADEGNARILVYSLNADNSIPTASGGHTASYVLGQPGFLPSTLGSAWLNNCTATSIVQPNGGLAFDPANSRLFVTDARNGRILVFNTATVTDNMAATYVLGQPNFTTCSFYGGTPSQSVFTANGGLAYDAVNARLFVADSQNNRVLVFNVPTSVTNGTSYGENATYVFGQTNFTSTGTGTTSTTLNTFYYASSTSSVAYDPVNQRLFVADTENNRVLVYNAPLSLTNGTSYGEAASYVLGEPNLTTAGNEYGAVTQSNLDFPVGLAYDPTNSRLFVSDANPSRVLVYNVGPSVIQNGEKASFLIGISPSTCGGNIFNCYSNGGTTQSMLDWPYSLYFDPGSQRLFVTDGATNNRVMIFDVTPMNTPTQTGFIPGYE